MTINTRQGLIDFALRQLGGGVVNVEVTPDQCNDAVDVALEWAQEFYFDGIERDYIARAITASVATVASTAGLSVGDKMTYATTGTYAIIKELTGTTITFEKMVGLTKFAATNSISNGTTSVTIVSIVLGDIDNGYFALHDDIVGVIRVMNASSMYGSSDLLFNPQYQIMQQEVFGISSSGGVSYYVSVMNYMSHLNFELNNEKGFRFNRRWNRVHLDVNWGIDVKIGQIVVIECYRWVNPEVHNEVYNDRWLKEYTTALIKRQLGTNLKKYSGMSLPGGVTYNGQQIYNEAIQEIEKIQDQVIAMSAPIYPMMG